MQDAQPMTTVGPTPEDMARLLAEPFDPCQLKMKPQVVQGNRALAVFYVDARAVQDRLDAVLGVDGWQVEFTPLENNNVACKLSCRFPSGWVVKGDVGGPSEQPDAGDRLKAAYSDALKRAAVHFGVGRYIYRIPTQWLAYDAQKKQFVGVPKLGPAAVPYVHQANGRSLPATNGHAPKELPAVAEPVVVGPTADQRWQAVSELARRYATILKAPVEQVLRDLRRNCQIGDGTPHTAFTPQQWVCLEDKLQGAIRKRSVLDTPQG